MLVSISRPNEVLVISIIIIITDLINYSIFTPYNVNKVEKHHWFNLSNLSIRDH